MVNRFIGFFLKQCVFPFFTNLCINQLFGVKIVFDWPSRNFAQMFYKGSLFADLRLSWQSFTPILNVQLMLKHTQSNGIYCIFSFSKKFLIDFIMYCSLHGAIVSFWMLFGFYVYFCGYAIYSNSSDVSAYSQSGPCFQQRVMLYISYFLPPKLQHDNAWLKMVQRFKKCKFSEIRK